TSFVKFVDHEFYGGYRGIKCRNGGTLCNGIGPTGDLSLKFVTGLGYPIRSAYISYSPSGHGKGLGHPVYGNGTVVHAINIGDANVTPLKIDVFIDFVRDHKDIGVLAQYGR